MQRLREVMEEGVEAEEAGAAMEVEEEEEVDGKQSFSVTSRIDRAA